MEKKRRRESLLKKSVPLWAVVVIFLILSGTVCALAVHYANVEKISIWGGTIQESEFEVTGLETKPKGPNKIDVSVTLRNTNNIVHSANVTVQLLDANGDVIIEGNQDTGDVSPGGTKTLNYSFVQNNLVAEFKSSFIVIKDLT